MTLNHDYFNDKIESKMNSPDRVLVLKPREGEKTLNSKGMVDGRLFKGENKLHALMDQETSLWTLKYEQGITPEPLQHRFTSFKNLMDYVTKYYDKRGVDVENVTQNAPSRYYP